MGEEGGPDFTAHMSSASTGMTFESELFAFGWAKAQANEKLFNIIRSSRRKRADGSYHHYFTCECADRKESDTAAQRRSNKRRNIFSNLAAKGKRITSSKRVGCQFRGSIRKEDDGLYHVHVFKGCHNHPLTYYIEGNLAYTRLTDEDRLKIKEMWFAHCALKAIVKALKYADNLKPVLSRAVYNYTTKLKKEAAEGRNPAMQFLQMCRERDYFTRHELVPGTRTLRDLFWCHPNSRKMLRIYITVFCLDSTYSTNKYEYALVEIVGVTPCNQNFTAAQALLQHENKESYLWAMRCFAELLGDTQPKALVTDRELGLLDPIKNVFPNSHHLLCMFHVKKMIRAKTLHILHSAKDADRLCNGAVRVMLHSPTVEIFEENYNKLRCKYGWVRGFIKYIDDTWLPHKEKIVLAWTNRARHFGNNTTNRVEGAHSSLKAWMSSYRGGLDTLFEKTHAEVESQIAEIKCRLEWSQSKKLHGFGVSPFALLQRRVSHHCLTLLMKECTKLGKCTHAFRTVHGLPCRCQIEDLRDKGDFIQLENVDPFWRTLAYDGVAVDVLYCPCPFDLEKMFRDLEGRDAADWRRVTHLVRAEMYHEEGVFDEPVPKVTKRGRPPKKNANMPRLLSGWEHTDKQFRSSQTEPAITASDELLYMAGGRDVPLFVREYLVAIDNVEGDGNCGFRCAALRFLKSANLYVTVRSLIVTELNLHRDIYKEIYPRADGGVKAAANRIDWKGNKCYISHWMKTPSDLFAIAQVFRAVTTVYAINDTGGHECTTVLPWRGNIEDYGDLPEISLILRRGMYHFVLGHFSVDDDDVPDNPLPKMHPTWFRIRNKSLQPWEERYGERLERFQNLQAMFCDHLRDTASENVVIDP